MSRENETIEKTRGLEKASLVARILAESAFLAKGLFSGVYRSKIKGKGIEFDTLREYSSNDDKKEVDWRASAKFDKLFVKTFSEERELSVVLIVDVSRSFDFGSTEDSKKIFSARLAGLLAIASLKNRDKVGLLLFSDKIEKYIPPRKGLGHFQRMIEEIIETKGQIENSPLNNLRKNGLDSSLKFLKKIIRKKTLCFLFSDFIFDPPSNQTVREFLQLHDIAPFCIFDRMERSLPFKSILFLQEMETGAVQCFDAKQTAGKPNASFEENQRQWIEFWKKWNKEMLLLENGSPFLEEFILFLKRRKPFKGE